MAQGVGGELGEVWRELDGWRCARAGRGHGTPATGATRDGLEGGECRGLVRGGNGWYGESRAREAMQLVIAVVAHAVRQERRLFTGEGLERLSTWWVYKVQGRSVEEGSGARGASGTEDAAALAAVVPALAERERSATGESVAMRGLRVGLPEIAREEHS